MEVTFQCAARRVFPCPFRRRLQRVQCLAPSTRQLGTGGTRKKRCGRTLASAKPRLRRTICKCSALVEPPLICEEDVALLFANFRAHLAQASGPVVARPGLVSGFAHRRQRGLTGRSSGPAAARHQGPVGGTLYIFAIRALASRHCGPLTYNVRHQMDAALPAMTFKPQTAFSAQFWNVTALNRLYAPIDNCLEVPKIELVELLPIVVFMAFSIESYINSLGFRKVELWGEIERSPWRKKINILHKTASKTPDWEKGHLQFCAKLFALRDRLAHGQPTRHFGPGFDTPEEAEKFALSNQYIPDWFQEIDAKWIVAARERYTELMAYLAGMQGLPENDYCEAYRIQVFRVPADA